MSNLAAQKGKEIEREKKSNFANRKARTYTPKKGIEEISTKQRRAQEVKKKE